METRKHTMKLRSLCLLAALVAAPAIAGEPAATSKNPVPPPPADPFASARRPVTNPTLFDLALPRTNIHPIFMYQSLPDKVATILGELPAGGDFQVYALQAEYAFNDRLSLVAVKDGYIDFNPDGIFSSEEGFANLGAGLKYVLLRNDAAGFAMSGSATLRYPSATTMSGKGKATVPPT